MTVGELEQRCQQAATAQAEKQLGYAATPKQIFFFVLVWAAKQGIGFQQRTDELVGLSAEAIQKQINLVVATLPEWGETVRGLQDNDEREWLDLSQQMQRAIRRYHTGHDTEDSLQDATVKILGILFKMPSPTQLENAPDIVQSVIQNRRNYSNLYDFDTPFYAFAKMVTRNSLHEVNRKRSTNPDYPLEEWHEGPKSETPEAKALQREQRREWEIQLQIDLTNLLAALDQQLAPKARQVILFTLAGRPRFWEALELAGVEPPSTFPPRTASTTDAELAEKLATTTNSIAVHRAQSKTKLANFDPLLGRLLVTLMDPHA